MHFNLAFLNRHLLLMKRICTSTMTFISQSQKNMQDNKKKLVIMQKGKFQNGYFKKTKRANFFEIYPFAFLPTKFPPHLNITQVDEHYKLCLFVFNQVPFG